jgi:NADH-quinone oxidoreductase subunit L
MSVIAIIGTATALLAASIALVQREMKKILAYSTVSQLGFMFAAVGVGAFTAGIFHVFTHAFFKACLFLGAGSVMHAVGAHGDADIFKLGGLRKILPKTHATFLVACLAISGVPFFAGFFSKDEILLGASLLGFAGDEAFSSSLVGWFVLGGLTIAATMTAFYMFRLYFLTFSGTYRSAGEGEAHGHDHDHHAYDAHPHESPATMTIPLIVLATGSALAGLLGLPHAWGISFLHNWWGPWLEAAVSHVAGFGPEDHIENGVAVVVAAVCGLSAAGIGVGAAYALYKDASEDRFTARLPKAVYQLFFDKWRVDELYEKIILGPIRGTAVLVGRIDQTFVDALLTKATAAGVRALGWLTTRPQVGVVHAYGLAMVVGLAGMSYWVLYPHPALQATALPGGRVDLVAARGVGYEYRWDANGDGELDGESWSTEPTASNASWAPESYVGVRLLVSAPGVHNGPEHELEVGEAPILLTTSMLGRGWQGDALESTTPPAVTYDEEAGEIVVRPNLVRPALDEGGEPRPLPELRLRPGQTGRLGPFILVTAAPVVRPRVEVRNAFGNVATDSVELVLRDARPAGHRISLGTPGAHAGATEVQ